MNSTKALQVLAILVLVGAGFRIHGLHGMWISPDEGIYYAIAHASSIQEAWTIINTNPHPPLFYGLLGLFGLIGDDPIWLRLPALIAGCGLIPVMFLFARELGGRVCGLVAAGLVTFSPGAIALSQVSRPYSLQALVLCLALWCLLVCLRHGKTWQLLLFAGLSSLALLLHYSSLQVLLGAAIVSVAIAWRRPDRSARVRLGLAQVPWIACFGFLYLTHIQPRLLGADLQRQAVDGWLAEGYIASVWDFFEVWRGSVEFLAGAAPLWVWLLGLGLGTWAAVKGTSEGKHNLSGASEPADLFILGVATTVAGLATLLSILDLYPLGPTRHSGYLLVPFAAVLGLGVARVVDGEIRLPMSASPAILFAAVLAGVAPLAIGMSAGRGHPRPELTTTRVEVEETVLPAVRKLLDSPGTLLMDQETAHALAPLLQAEVGFLYRGGVPRVDLLWGQRHLHIAPACWIMLPDGTGPQDLVCTLREALSGLAPSEGEFHLVSMNWRRVANTYAPLISSPTRGRGPLQQLTQTDCCAVLRVDLSRIR